MTSLLDRLLGRPEPARHPSAKAVVSTAPWSNGIPLSSLNDTPQKKAAAGLRAYKVGWFYKAGRKIAGDISTLDWAVSDGDMEEGEEETTLKRPPLSLPFASLSPIEQFMRLLERPNPSQTGRQLFHKTQIRLDFAGAACWYLEGGAGGFLPSALYGISPARMWPSRNKAGELIGWVMDYDQPSGGVPFDVSEILWFSTGNADQDDDIWGTSVVESVYSQVPLTDMMARHTANVLTTGGRLAGMMWPKDRALSEDEYIDAQRAWRNVASDPDAGRRLLIFPEPMEYAQGASTPAEIGIPELAALNRDEILTAFPLSPYQLGVPMPGGLNSAETRREDRRDYWEGTIHPRADLLEEVIQVGLLSRYEQATGQTFDFDIAEPNLDDAASLSLKAKAFKDLVGIGLDPTESIKAVGLGDIKFLGLPDLLDPAKQAEAAQAATEALAERPQTPPPAAGKALPPTRYEADIARFFTEQRDRLIAAIAETYPASKSARKSWADKADPDWWDQEREDRELRAALRPLYAETTRNGLQKVADQLNRIIAGKKIDPILRAVLQYGASRIEDINARTKRAVQQTVAEGVRRGYSITQLTEGVPAEGYSGLLGVTLENGAPAFGELRAETIARTETALAYNRSSLESYKDFGVRRLEAIDGDDDETCAERNGTVFDVDEALAIEDHPNGTLDWIPLV